MAVQVQEDERRRRRRALQEEDRGAQKHTKAGRGEAGWVSHRWAIALHAELRLRCMFTNVPKMKDTRSENERHTFRK
jgi:hypothetical protein